MEQWYIRTLAAEAGTPYGLTADGVLEEAMTLLAWPLAELQRELNVLSREREALEEPHDEL